MSLTAEEVAKREYVAMTESDKVRVRVKVKWLGDICLPDPKGKQEVEAVFRVLNFGDNHALEKATTYEVKIMSGSRQVATNHVSDIHEYKRLLVKRNLLAWSLDVPIVRSESGWMTAESYRRVSSIPAPLMEALVIEFEKTASISEEEEKLIERQSVLLFSKTGRGVTDACEAVSMFCTLGNLWEKFGWDKNTIPTIPYKEYLMMKVMVSKEGESMKQQARQNKSSSPNVIGPGGKPRPSRATKIPL